MKENFIKPLGKIILVLFLLSTTIIFMGCGNSSSGNQGNPNPKELTIDEKADKILASMSKTEKIGQLVMIGIHGTDVTEDSLYQLHQFHFGGVVLFDRNMKSIEQVTKLNKNLQEQCEEKVPLFIAIDEEGGKVARMKDVLEPPKSQLDIGKTGKVENAQQSAYDISQKLKEMGFNVNFAPVADLGSFKDRHFSSDPMSAAEFVGAAAKGYEEAGMIYSLKHFPGIGKGKTDSHDDSVSVNISEEELFKSDIIPFQKVIEGNDNSRFMVMVSHVNYPKIDGDTPASISSVIMKDFLRDKLNYQGIIITDDMEMGAIAKHYGFKGAAVQAVKAGADIVLMCHEYENEQEAYLGLLEALDNGDISQKEIDDKVRRIIKAKLLIEN